MQSALAMVRGTASRKSRNPGNGNDQHGRANSRRFNPGSHRRSPFGAPAPLFHRVWHCHSASMAKGGFRIGR
jgi:hypothetical protein